MEREKNSVGESRAESWMRRFSEWEESGLSQREFCRTRGISSRATVRIHGGGTVVEADAGIDPERLKVILDVVRGI